ncbi:ABC transporter ATP-binding protein [Salinirubellus salinus]|uniref:ABC transporter ATP-binding protein n=1 Tax=Salinirubellus salinus TaxID=1364945 RepID=A0A9E7QZH9_9EURY|nr:ABC transporter ATP-binding protein [Salinirubellus salinus]UWM52783.1 ABC transporter ATP-binding protein [Salinirubellus salinus]
MDSVETSHLTKRYGDTVAVDSLDLAVPEGTVYGFLGPNGAGKTTTMRMLTSLVRPTSGSATVAGVNVTDREALVSHIGYLPEEPPLYDELTAREQLTYAAGLRGIPEPTARERMDDYFERLDLADDADLRIDAYSKGMRQKTAFVQALLHEPDVLFLDEPTSGLDPRAARTIRDTIDGLADSGTTVFLSTHILPVVDEHADVVGVLSEGRLVAEGPPADLKRRADAGEEADDDRSLEDVFLDVTSEDPASGDSDSEDEGETATPEAASAGHGPEADG